VGAGGKIMGILTYVLTLAYFVLFVANCNHDKR